MYDESPQAPAMARWILLAGALHGFLAVALGAFGAHGLRSRLEGLEDGVKRLEWWTTAAHYQLVHAVALVAIGALARHGMSLGLSGGTMAVGALVFSGTLYAMTLGAPRWFGAITPIGGLLLLVGWAALFWAALRTTSAG